MSAIAPAPALAPVASAEHAPSTRVPSKRELMAALHATPVSMFATSWCPHCQRARRFFQAYGLSVVDHDVDADAQAAAELKRRSGGKAVPLIDVDGQELKGFNEQATMEAVVASVERRLGVTGVKLSVTSASDWAVGPQTMRWDDFEELENERERQVIRFAGG
jgi:glutaredoxin